LGRYSSVDVDSLYNLAKGSSCDGHIGGIAAKGSCQRRLKRKGGIFSEPKDRKKAVREKELKEKLLEQESWGGGETMCLREPKS